MAITCPRCGAQFDVTLFQFGHCVRRECGQWVELERGHMVDANPPDDDLPKESHRAGEPPDQ